MIDISIDIYSDLCFKKEKWYLCIIFLTSLFRLNLILNWKNGKMIFYWMKNHIIFLWRFSASIKPVYKVYILKCMFYLEGENRKGKWKSCTRHFIIYYVPKSLEHTINLRQGIANFGDLLICWFKKRFLVPMTQNQKFKLNQSWS